MNRIEALLVSAALFLVTSTAYAAMNHIRVPLESNANSGISGFVQLTQLPKGGANVVMNIEGLEPGSSYSTFYYESDDCSAPAAPILSFVADKNGKATVHGKIDADLDVVGSLSVRVGPEFGNLLACGYVHSQNRK
ncbi:MAG: hypothetical protein ACREOU_12595 [Candidatus Eiseniibacteriota bacterium]